MFMQLRLLMTGVIYQFLFNRKLSGKQWISLLILTLGCMLQRIQNYAPNFEAFHAVSIGSGLLLIGLQVFQQKLTIWVKIMIFFFFFQVCCSVFAGVYNEYIIKKIAGADVDIMIQNVFMYLDSIFCNVLVLAYNSELQSNLTQENLLNLWSVLVIAIILNNALVGIVTSLFLKNLNSILKAFASAIELIFTALLSYVLLHIPLHWNTILAVTVISYAVVMYAQNPLKTEEIQEKSLPK